MKHQVTIDINTDAIRDCTDMHLATLWHVAQANPAPDFDRDAGELADAIGREIIRRFLRTSEPELYAHLGIDCYWHILNQHGKWIDGTWRPNAEIAAAGASPPEAAQRQPFSGMSSASCCDSSAERSVDSSVSGLGKEGTRTPITLQKDAPVIIYAAQDSGKTRHAAALARHYGKSNVVEELAQWDLLPSNTIAFTNNPDIRGAIPLSTALQDAGIYSTISPANNINLSVAAASASHPFEAEKVAE